MGKTGEGAEPLPVSDISLGGRVQYMGTSRSQVTEKKVRWNLLM